MLILQALSDCSSLVLFNSLVKVSARVADITCITQVTLKMINNALLIHKGWLVFPHFDFVLDLSTCVHRADSCIDLPTEVCKLSAYCICRFLVLKRQHDSDWGFIVVRNLLLCLRFLRYFEYSTSIRRSLQQGLTAYDRIWKHCRPQAGRLMSKICVQFDARKKIIKLCSAYRMTFRAWFYRTDPQNIGGQFGTLSGFLRNTFRKRTSQKKPRNIFQTEKLQDFF